MSQEYRVVKTEVDNGWSEYTEDWNDRFSIALIRTDHFGNKGYVVDNVTPSGDSLSELREDLESMLKALDKPILEERHGVLWEEEP